MARYVACGLLDALRESHGGTNDGYEEENDAANEQENLADLIDDRQNVQVEVEPALEAVGKIVHALYMNTKTKSQHLIILVFVFLHLQNFCHQNINHNLRYVEFNTNCEYLKLEFGLIYVLS